MTDKTQCKLFRAIGTLTYWTYARIDDRNAVVGESVPVPILTITGRDDLGRPVLSRVEDAWTVAEAYP